MVLRRWTFVMSFTLVLFVLQIVPVSAEHVVKGDDHGNNPNTACVVFVNDGGFAFQTYCASCHGNDARGGGPAGASFDPPPSDLIATNKKYTDVELATSIAKGKNNMPSWRETLDDNGIWSIISWLRTRQ